ncbi:MAG: hypothetical protein ACOY0S_03640 [Patescibacteria group bacterium]
MRKPARTVHRRQKSLEPIPWLPIDSRLFSHLFAFGHVRGWARFFLELEIGLAIAIVVGTLVLVVLQLFT